MEKYCPKPHPVYFNAFSMWQQLSSSVQYLIKYNTYNLEGVNFNNFYYTKLACFSLKKCLHVLELQARKHKSENLELC